MTPQITNTLSDPQAEPAQVRDARITYWTRRQHLNTLEARITARGDRARDWVQRVKRIGKR